MHLKIETEKQPQVVPYVAERASLVVEEAVAA
jgi:hypothetical protein